MPKPTYASVTEQPCTCDYLQNAANDDANPIIFDEKTSEYQFAYHEPGLDGPSTLIIYHCPFCGGAAPESKRSLLFAVIPKSEEERLLEMLAPIETISQAMAILGTPDFDGHIKVRDPERDNKPFSLEYHREIRYEKLSDLANIWITERPDGKVFWQLQGKYIGR